MSAYPGPMLKGGFSPLLLPYPKGLEEEGGGAPSTRPELPLSQQEAFYRHLVCLLNLLAHVVAYTPTVCCQSFFFSLLYPIWFPMSRHGCHLTNSLNHTVDYVETKRHLSVLNPRHDRDDKCPSFSLKTVYLITAWVYG